MKKLITMMLVVAIIAVMVVPAFAEDTAVTVVGEGWENSTYDGTYISNGVYKLKVTISEPNFTVNGFVLEDGVDISSAEKVVVPSSFTTADTTYTCNKIGSALVNATAIGVKEVYIPKTITTVDNSAFNACASIERFTCEDGGSYSDEDGILYKGNALVRYPVGRSATSYQVAKNVTSLSTNAFYGSKFLETVTFEEGSRISMNNDNNRQIFNSCTALKSIVLPDGYTSVQKSTFGGCTSLENVVLSPRTTAINSYAFSDCTSLKTITIPASVTKFGESVFKNDSSLKEVVFMPATVPTLSKAIFAGVDPNVVIYHPQDATTYTRDAFTTAYNTSFPATGLIVPFGGYITGITEDATTTTVDYTYMDINNNAEIIALVSVYDDSGCLLAVKTLSTPEGRGNTTFNVTGVGKAKILVWNTKTAAKPLYKSYDYTIAE